MPPLLGGEAGVSKFVSRDRKKGRGVMTARGIWPLLPLSFEAGTETF